MVPEDLLRLLDAEDKDTVVRAFVSLHEYYFQNLGWIGNGPEFNRERFKEQANAWYAKFKGMTREQILFARLKEEPTQYILDYVPDVLARDHAIDYLTDWAMSEKEARVYGLWHLHKLMGLDLLGSHSPNPESIALAGSYWKHVLTLGAADRTRLQAIGRLLTYKHEGYPICDRISESAARKVFLNDEERSLELWQQLYDYQPAWGNTIEQIPSSTREENRAYVSGTVASHQYKYLVVLARVNSTKSIARLKEIGTAHKSEWLRGAVRNLLLTPSP